MMISVPETPQTNHSQNSSPAVEALLLIVDSKSQPVELDNSTIVPSRRKKLFCGFYDLSV